MATGTKKQATGDTKEAPVLLPLSTEEQRPGAPGAPAQWGSRNITIPHKVQLTLRKGGAPARQLLAEAIAEPGYVEFLGEPVLVTPPIPPPVAVALSGFSGPATAAQGTSIPLTATLSGPAPTNTTVLVTGQGINTGILIGAGTNSGTAMVTVTPSTPPGPWTLTAAYQGKSLSHTVTVTAISPGPEPPTPSPEGTLGYCAVDAKATGTGAQDNPWPLADALTGKYNAKFSNGGTVWLLPGTYKATQLDPEGVGFLMTTSGSAGKPLVFRAAQGARAIIDGGLAWWGISHDVWLQDLEFIVTEPKPFGTSGSNPSPAGSPRGGIHVYSGGSGNKCLNCILGAMADQVGKQNRQGASIWLPAREFELYGCLIVDNGWVGTDRGHGHGAYIQNPPGSYRKYAKQNIFQNRNTRGFTSGRYMFHIYGESPMLSNVTAELNTVIGSEPSLFSDGFSASPSAGHELIRNTFAGCRVQVASSPIAPAHISGNTWVNGTLEIVGDGSGQIVADNLLVPPQPRPNAAAGAAFQVNAYDAKRANLTVIDWARAGAVRCPLAGWAQKSVRVLDPTDFWGPPVFAGVVPPEGVTVPVGSFGVAAYVVVQS